MSASQPLLPPNVTEAVFEAVSNALYNNLWLNVVYKNAAGKRTASEVMPLGLAQQGFRLYLVCRFQGFEDERSLALHRITSAKPSTIPFAPPKKFSLQKFDEDGKFGFGSGQRINLTFRIDKEVGLHLTESPLSSDQTVRTMPSEYEISATVIDSVLLDHWLAGFGSNVRLIKKRPAVR